MLITNLIGGLGNQMFQYAAARAISLDNFSTLKIDIADFSHYGLHQGFELQRIFDSSIEIANAADLRMILGWQSSRSARRILCKPNMRWLRSKKFIVEPHLSYWNGLRNLHDDAYLVGYWQSQNYFMTHSAQIREDFKFKLPMSKENYSLSKQMNDDNSVSLHVRRGDYVNNSKTTLIHGLCSIDYYQSAIKYIADRLNKPIFYVFSDDIEWVKKNLNIKFPHAFLSHNTGRESFNDMRLMATCKHNIIANSSFSWWGAWLNPNEKKIVVAPEKWFANPLWVNNDIIPPEWHCI